MSKKPNTAAIGGFVIGAAALAIFALALWGGFGLSGPKPQFACFFDQTVTGLQIGSSVRLRGVPVGQVKRILVQVADPEHPSDTSGPTVPVIIELDQRRLAEDLGVKMNFGDPEVLAEQINAGLHAKLEADSLITGVLHVNLDYLKDGKVPTAPGVSTLGGEAYPTIPTVPSDLARATKDIVSAVNNISNTDFKGLAEQLAGLLEKLNSKVGELGIAELNKAVVEISEAATALRARLESEDVDRTLGSLADAADEFKVVAGKLNSIASKIDDQVGDEDIKEILDGADQSLATLNNTLADLNGMVKDDSQFRGKLDNALDEIAAMADKVGALAAYLEEHPNSIIFGRKDKGGDDRELTDDERSVLERRGVFRKR
ncbi:MAG: MlaD family protein [Verrucomicrobiales bacterium]